MGWTKSGKPPRERPDSEAHDHQFESVPDPWGRPVNGKLLGKLVGAAFDGCMICQDPLIQETAADPDTTARLVEVACIAVNATLGGLPHALVDESAAGIASKPFRLLARAGIDGANDRMWQTCRDMPESNRLEAIGTALNLIIGHLGVA